MRRDDRNQRSAALTGRSIDRTARRNPLAFAGDFSRERQSGARSQQAAESFGFLAACTRLQRHLAARACP